jgi:hypothetical protein
MGGSNVFIIDVKKCQKPPIFKCKYLIVNSKKIGIFKCK